LEVSALWFCTMILDEYGGDVNPDFHVEVVIVCPGNITELFLLLILPIEAMLEYTVDPLIALWTGTTMGGPVFGTLLDTVDEGHALFCDFATSMG